MALPAAAYLSNSARTVAEMKTAMEDQRGIAPQQPGAVNTLGEEISPAGGGFIGVPKTLHKREKRKKAAANPSQHRL